MKGLNFATATLGAAMVMLTVSVGMMGWTAFKMAGNDTDKANTFFGNMKMLVIAPTVMNVLSVALLGALLLMG